MYLSLCNFLRLVARTGEKKLNREIDVMNEVPRKTILILEKHIPKFSYNPTNDVQITLMNHYQSSVICVVKT